jgi:hypothetical protein
MLKDKKSTGQLRVLISEKLYAITAQTKLDLHSVQTSSGTHQASYAIGTRSDFPRG